MEQELICLKCGKPCDESNAFKNRQGQWFHNACIAEHMSNTPEYGLKQLLIEIGLKCCIGIAFSEESLGLVMRTWHPKECDACMASRGVKTQELGGGDSFMVGSAVELLGISAVNSLASLALPVEV